MAVKKRSRVIRPRQEPEPDNKYTQGGPSGGLEPGASGPTQGSGAAARRARNTPLSPTEGFFPEGGHRYSQGGPPRSEHSRPSVQDRPGYFKYFLDDVNAPLIAGRGNPGLIAELQRRLAAVGLLEGRAPRGVWDPTTENAYKRLLEIANVWEVTDQEALNQLMAESEGAVVDEGAGSIGRRTSDGSGEGGRGTGFRIQNGEFVPEGPEAFTPPPLTLRLPDTEETNRMVRRLSIDLGGQALDQQSIDAITSAYIAKVTELQRGAHSQIVERERQLWDTGTTNINEITDVELPTAESFAEGELGQRPDVQANKGMELLMGALGMWGR